MSPAKRALRHRTTSDHDGRLTTVAQSAQPGADRTGDVQHLVGVAERDPAQDLAPYSLVEQQGATPEERGGEHEESYDPHGDLARGHRPRNRLLVDDLVNAGFGLAVEGPMGDRGQRVAPRCTWGGAASHRDTDRRFSG